MLTARQLYFEAVKPGDELPPLVKPPVDRLQIARYAAAAQDWNPLYIDEPFAKNAGFPSALAPGMIAMGFLAELAVDWVRGARLRKFGARFVKIVWPGDVLTARGRVTDRRFEEGGRYGIDVEVWAENQRGELVVRGTVTFQLYYSAEDEARQRQGQPPLVVTREEEEARLAKLSRAQPPRPAAQAGRTLAPPRPVVPPPGRQPGPAPLAVARPAAAPPKAGKPAKAKAKPSRPARAARPRPAARKGAKAKARPRPAKRAARPAKPKARAHRPAKKPSGKKRR
ncbi:MAG TPA: MaoC/PaaZ C-terminal domain-containing protein [Anaeromyxobacter sp.]|nr:MaoC/PaaZ C-terminal domain-containing protein [Anaeromyxobacter sp.]